MPDLVPFTITTAWKWTGPAITASIGHTPWVFWYTVWDYVCIRGHLGKYAGEGGLDNRNIKEHWFDKNSKKARLIL